MAVQPKGISNLGQGRRWDVEEFALRAKERLAAEMSTADPVKNRKNQTRMTAPLPPQRAYLQARERELPLDDKRGRTQIISPNLPTSEQAGFYCEVCDCVVKDSANYLDHINGKKHQRACGLSMRVEKVGVDRVSARLALHAQRKADQAAGFTRGAQVAQEVKQRREEQEKRQEDRKRRKLERRQMMKEARAREKESGGDDATRGAPETEGEGAAGTGAEGEVNEDDRLMAAMGLPVSFGGR